MTKEERNAFLSREYLEATRYMDNAEEILRKSGKDGSYYVDAKYVRAACGMAYLGVLIALDAWLTAKDVALPQKRKQKSIIYYKESVAKLDGRMLSRLNTAYNQLHLEGYYWLETSVKAISGGFDAAYEIIDKIKPETPVAVKENRAAGLKRALKALLISAAAVFN